MSKPTARAKPAVGLFAKPPKPGEVKTRLVPPLAPEEAAALYAAFLGDLADMLEGDPAWDWIAYSPDPHALRAGWPLDAPRPEMWRQQVDGDLGARMGAALEELLAEGRPSAILLGSDHPTVSRDMIANAFHALETAEVVLGPSQDGGLYIVGWASVHPELMQDIPWSTERVLETVVARARAHGVSTALLDPWYDVDDARDLAFLRAHLCALELTQGETAPCPRTRAALTRAT
jgi:hypothetical protein